MDTVTGIVAKVYRKGLTIYGNPIVDVIVDGDEYRISDNASLIYAIDNAEFKEYPHTFALTKAGRISKVIR